MEVPRLILASASLRRKKLLGATGIIFEIIESGIDEARRSGEGARDYALRMAREKALSVSARHPDALVLGADTVVEFASDILVKPDSASDARRMLRLLSGNTHTVVTAFALARGNQVVANMPVISRVTFRVLADDEIDSYVATGEPFDKAGSYGIQGAGAAFIVAVKGSRDNVMGLPMAQVLDVLRRHGVEVAAERGEPR
jgi:septum formation protein